MDKSLLPPDLFDPKSDREGTVSKKKAGAKTGPKKNGAGKTGAKSGKTITSKSGTRASVKKAASKKSSAKSSKSKTTANKDTGKKSQRAGAKKAATVSKKTSPKKKTAKATAAKPEKTAKAESSKKVAKKAVAKTTKPKTVKKKAPAKKATRAKASPPPRAKTPEAVSTIEDQTVVRGHPLPRPEPERRKPEKKKPGPSAKPSEDVAGKPASAEPSLDNVSDFPWEHPDGEEPRVPCKACGEPVHPDARVCIHCGSPFIECPHCREACAALHDPKMATEQRLNKILKQYTLFSLALPALPMQPIMSCSCCRQRIILCESCRTPLKMSANDCPNCGFKVRRTKLIINPFSILESFLKRPDMGKSLQKSVENFLRSISEW